MAIMVTGTGFVGAYVVRDLLAEGEDVVLYGYFGGRGEAASTELPDLKLLDHLLDGDLFEKVTVVVGDITDLSAIASAIAEHEVTRVIHLAGMVAAASAANPPMAVRVNAEGTANVFEAAVKQGVERVAWASSVTVFGHRSLDPDGIIRDTSPHAPENVYGATKVLSEHLATRYFDDYGLSTVGIRPNRVYGFGEHVKSGRGSGSAWLFDAIHNAALESGPARLLFGDQHLDFHYIDDVADAFVRAMRSTAGAGKSYLTHGDFRPIADAARFLKQILPSADIELISNKSDLPVGSTKTWARKHDATPAEHDLGIRTRTSMERGLFETVGRYRALAGLSPLDPDLLTKAAATAGN